MSWSSASAPFCQCMHVVWNTSRCIPICGGGVENQSSGTCYRTQTGYIYLFLRKTLSVKQNIPGFPKSFCAVCMPLNILVNRGVIIVIIFHQHTYLKYKNGKSAIITDKAKIKHEWILLFMLLQCLLLLHPISQRKLQGAWFLSQMVHTYLSPLMALVWAKCGLNATPHLTCDLCNVELISQEHEKWSILTTFKPQTQS